MSDRVQRFLARVLLSGLDQSVIELGEQAFARGRRLEDNPWAPGPREYDLWRRGFIRAGLKAQEVHDEA